MLVALPGSILHKESARIGILCIFPIVMHHLSSYQRPKHGKIFSVLLQPRQSIIVDFDDVQCTCMQ